MLVPILFAAGLMSLVLSAVIVWTALELRPQKRLEL